MFKTSVKNLAEFTEALLLSAQTTKSTAGLADGFGFI